MDLNGEFLQYIQNGLEEQALLTLNDHKEELTQLALDSGLCWASRQGMKEVIKVLLQNTANPNANLWEGISPLLWATMFSNDPEIIMTLLEGGSNIQHSSAKRRQTALHAAVIRGNILFASIFLEWGANPDAQDFMFKTPLLHAIQRRNSSCAKLLIKFNCNVNLSGWVNGTNTTPLSCALMQNDIDCTKLLLLAGARFETPAVFQMYTMSQFYSRVENDLHFQVRPIYLQQHCRICIRHLLKPHFKEKLRQLYLPQQLKDFLDLDDIDVDS